MCTLKGMVASSFSCWDSWYKWSKHALHCMLYMLCMLPLSTQKITVCKTLNTMYAMLCWYSWNWCLWFLYKAVYSVHYTLHCIQGLSYLQEGRLLYCTAFCLVGLAVHQSEETAFLTFWDLSTTRIIAGKMHSQSPILKKRGTQQPGNS